MKANFLAGAIVACGVMLGGCATLQPGQSGTVGTAPAEYQHIIAEVQTIAKGLCGFVPIAATITNLFTGGATLGAFEIARLICGAVSGAALASAGGPQVITVMVRGVRVSGVYTPKKGK